MRHLRPIPTFALLVTLAAAGAALAQSRITNLRDAPLDQNGSPPPMRAQLNTDLREVRNYPEQPPLIPHAIEGYQVDLNANKCLSCHARARTGEGQWVDLSCTEAGLTLHGAALLDYTVNGRPMRRSGMPDSNRSQSPCMAPHGVYPAAGEDRWIAIACRDDREWAALAARIDAEWARDSRYAAREGRIEHQDELDRAIGAWTRGRDRFALEEELQKAGVAAAAVRLPAERIDDDPNVTSWGLFPEATHSKMGRVRVDGLPVHFSKTDWHIERGGPCLGEHNERVYGDLLGLSASEIAGLREEGVI